MVPGFGVEGGPALALARGLSVAGLLAVFGTLLFRAVIAPPVLAGMPADRAAAFDRTWRRLLGWSWVAAVATLFAWLLGDTAFIASASSVRATASALPTVLADTRFGHLVLWRLAALVLAAAAFRFAPRGLWIATALAAIAVALQAGHGHAASMYDGLSWLLVSDVAHLLAAGAWLGALPPLYLLIVAAPAAGAARASRRFSPMATVCVVVLAITASFQFWVLIGGLPGLFGTGYGLMALVKLALFMALLGFAAVNRFRFTPALAGAAAGIAKRRLARSIAVETGVGLLVVLAAGVLTSLPPSMHIEPVWPFRWRFSLVTVREDPDFMREVLLAAAALGLGIVLVAAALALKRLRLAAVALAVAIAWFAVPHLSLLVVPAQATSFYHSPTGFAATTIADGSGLFAHDCAVCHGEHGGGNGPAAAGLPVPPANLTAPHLWMHSDGELFGWISNGIEAPEGGLAMPGFAGALSPGQRWALIDYIRANNAGIEMLRAGRWPVPLRAPAIQASCHGKTVTLDDLRGRIVRLVIGSGAAVADMPGVVTIVAAPHAAPGAVCFSDDTSVPVAYSVVVGQNAAPGSQFLIDAQGWLRAWQRPSTHASWSDPAVLAAAVGDIRSHPVRATGGGMPMDMPMNMKM